MGDTCSSCACNKDGKPEHEVAVTEDKEKIINPSQYTKEQKEKIVQI